MHIHMPSAQARLQGWGGSTKYPLHSDARLAQILVQIEKFCDLDAFFYQPLILYSNVSEF